MNQTEYDPYQTTVALEPQKRNYEQNNTAGSVTPPDFKTYDNAAGNKTVW